MIAEGDKVFKLIGPALVPQDTAEAIANVNTRLEFIGAEMYVHMRTWLRRYVSCIVCRACVYVFPSYVSLSAISSFFSKWGKTKHNTTSSLTCKTTARLGDFVGMLFRSLAPSLPRSLVSYFRCLILSLDILLLKDSASKGGSRLGEEERRSYWKVPGPAADDAAGAGHHAEAARRRSKRSRRWRWRQRKEIKERRKKEREKKKKECTPLTSLFVLLLYIYIF